MLLLLLLPFLLLLTDHHQRLRVLCNVSYDVTQVVPYLVDLLGDACAPVAAVADHCLDTIIAKEEEEEAPCDDNTAAAAVAVPSTGTGGAAAGAGEKTTARMSGEQHILI